MLEPSAVSWFSENNKFYCCF